MYEALFKLTIGFYREVFPANDDDDARRLARAFASKKRQDGESFCFLLLLYRSIPTR